MIGDQNIKQRDMWPSPGLISREEIFMQEMKLKGVNYQLNANNRIRGLQLLFSNG